MTKAQLRYGAFVLAMTIGVTVGGVAAGTLVAAPASDLSAASEAPRPSVTASVSTVLGASAAVLRTGADRVMTSATESWRTLPAPARRRWIPTFLGVLALTGFAATGASLLRRPPTLRLTLASFGVTPPAPGRNSRSGSRAPSRTPKAVQALADSGAEPQEIAWRTGLSLDAVAMLLSIGSNARQLRPPTA
jgi:hypothetical protein